MEKSISRFYFDYNATSPLAGSVRKFLAEGDFLYSNPSSAHTSGKKAYGAYKLASTELMKAFNLSDGHRIMMHSGATEGINTLIKGFAASQKRDGNIIHFFYSPTDHPCVFNLKESLQLVGHKVYPIDIDGNGNFDENVLIERMKSLGDVPILLNYTSVNNETGVVWDLERVARVKKQTGCYVHVDCAQAPGKIRGWDKLNTHLDCYTYSGHKFGALKGVGFSFIKKEFQFSPLIIGGGQQDGMRSGTVNVLGVMSMHLAIRELKENFSPDDMEQGLKYIHDALQELFGDKGYIVADKMTKNLNTISLIIKNNKSDVMLAAFDIAGIELSAGSACSAGILSPSRVLMSMGVDENDAKSFIRLSFGPDLSLELAKDYVISLTPIFERFLK
ncbi:MAG: aminotransferase class V-fold PLP-dependent enzyme [Bacteriovoracaceae bacterium]|nr:aminotransferase class V-fold PLP-dependent enzyme [Bacteriovoracaceae bacterium]